MEIAKQTLVRVIIGIWILSAVVIAAGIWFVDGKIAYVLGELIGSSIATGLMFHLYHCIDVEMDMSEPKAIAHSRLNAMLRLTVEIAAVLGCCFIMQIINPITVLLGLFGRKIGAMLVPLLFDHERTGEMLPEDKEELLKYGRLLSNKEKREMSDDSEGGQDG